MGEAGKVFVFAMCRFSGDLEGDRLGYVGGMGYTGSRERCSFLVGFVLVPRRHVRRHVRGG